MLVLTRKRDESIMIGDDIKIIVVDVRGDQVKLGIDAPRHIPVHREEVYKEIQEENRRAALKGTQDLSLLDEVFRRPGEAHSRHNEVTPHDRADAPSPRMTGLPGNSGQSDKTSG